MSCCGSNLMYPGFSQPYVAGYNHRESRGCSWIIIIIILLLVCDSGFNNGCGCDDGCGHHDGIGGFNSWWIIIIVLLLCCCDGF